ncbi:acetyl-CoA C-acyltransferase [Robbsia sp. KACC 23696]|uniref:acetyl-CoA C-acyltransferase n=1 Tax=Robbsia sp. KACC 23696 TaxID=3149231 RepID=UPI00325B0143
MTTFNEQRSGGVRQLQDAYIVAAVRTPIGKAPRGALRFMRPDDLLVHALRNVMAQVPSLDPSAVEDAVIGCAMPEAEQGLNVARTSVLLAGLPQRVGGITVNRFCASGLSALAMAADRIRVGEADVMIAGGVESMSMVPMTGNTPSINPQVYAKDQDVAIAYGMGLTAERVAERWKVSREDQDAFAVESHRRALAAQAAGAFTQEIASIDIVNRMPEFDGATVRLDTRTLSADEGPRADTSLEGLAKLKTVFAAKGSVTAGNSSQMSDGAAALVLVSERALKTFGLKPLARFVGFSVRGVAPDVMGIGPKEAIPAVLRATGLSQSDLDWIELNEAFAAQALAVTRDLDLDPSRVNPLGGAIALGHPLGATGAVRAATLVHGLQRTKQRYGMITMCVGTGMGAAGILERMD